MARKLLALFLMVCLGFVATASAAETFKLTSGDTLIGELLLASANDTGVQIKVGDGKYEKVSWASLSQDDLKRLVQNPKLTQFVEPFIEITKEDRIKKTEVVIKPVPRLEQPAKQSLFGAMFSSGLGWFLILVIYGANVYAAYEIAVFRARPPVVVCGVAAVAPFIGPIIFLSMPTNVKQEAESETAAATPVEAEGGADAVNPMLVDGATHPGSLHLHTEPKEEKPAVPEVQVFSRGQFTFNRRFIETKFANFFATVRHGAEKDLVMVLKTNRGEYTADRISRIAPNDLHIQVHRGATTEEVQVNLSDIQEIRLKHKDAH